jgi:hypothetical protein
MVERDPETGGYRTRPGREADLDKLREWVQGNVERLYGLAELR